MEDTQQAQLEQRKKVQQLSNFISSATSTQELLASAPSQILDIFRADRTTLYALDTKNRHLYSAVKTGGEFKEIRVGLDVTSLAGFVGSTKRAINIGNVYEAAELKRIDPRLSFDDRWDKASGYVTRNVLCVPMMHDGNLLGVLQIINRKDKQPFSTRDQISAEEIGQAFGMAFYNLNRVQAIQTARKPGRWDYLIDSGAFTEVELAQAEQDAAAAHVDLPRFLIEKKGIKRAEVEKSLAVFYNCEVFRFDGKMQIPEELRKKVRADYLKQICSAPVEKQGNELVVVIDDPRDLDRSEVLRAVEPGAKLRLMVGLRDEILAYIEQSYGLRGDVGSILKDLDSEARVEGGVEAENSDDGKVGESDSAVIKLANQIIMDAFRKGASDIHIEPNGKERNTVVRFRVDGDCIAYQDIPPQYRNAVVARIKIMANLDISEKRKPQDGKIRFKMPDRVIELRVATIPTVNQNEDVVARILAASKPIPLEAMGMSERNLSELRTIINKPYGLVLCVGPTGSGKTTTLHSALGSINTVDMKIWTAEDPVEITQAGLRQVQVQPKIGFTFEAAMRAFLRADPDVIMVGEMRDKETASTGIEASLTGHLVFSTLHTNSAPETVTRLIDMGLDPFSFADALLGVLAQRLARSICKTCREPYIATPEEEATVTGAFGGPEILAKWNVKPGQLTLYRGKGCDNCGGQGYKGRCGLHELLITNDSIKHSITSKAPVEEIRQAAMAGGMTTLLQDGVWKAMSGVTDLKQVLAVCSR